jgi:hypothetical protein
MKRADYRAILRDLDDWDEYLLENSGLPGPRANLELAQAVEEEGSSALFHRYVQLTPRLAPQNTPQEFLALCGTIGLGRLLADGVEDTCPALRALASDQRWRIREGVCMAMQRWGDRDMNGLLDEMWLWSGGNFLEQRAAVASLCEPRLLRYTRQIQLVLQLLDKVTESLHAAGERRGSEIRVLRQALGYCWSVAVAALPADGKPLMEKWCATQDHDVAWLMKENLRKARLVRMDAAWVALRRRDLS